MNDILIDLQSIAGTVLFLGGYFSVVAEKKHGWPAMAAGAVFMIDATIQGLGH